MNSIHVGNVVSVAEYNNLRLNCIQTGLFRFIQAVRPIFFRDTEIVHASGYVLERLTVLEKYFPIWVNFEPSLLWDWTQNLGICPSKL